MPDGTTVKRYAPNVTPDKIEGDIVEAIAEEPAA